VALLAVASALRPQPVLSSGCYAWGSSGATRPWRAATAHSGPPDSGGSPLGGEVKGGASGRRPCSAPAASSPIGVLCSAQQRGGQDLSRVRRPQRAPRLRGSPLGGEAGRRATRRCPGSVAATCSSAGIPRSALQRGDKARARLGRPQQAPHLAGSPLGGEFPVRRQAIAPALWQQPVSRFRLRARHRSSVVRLSRAVADGAGLRDPHVAQARRRLVLVATVMRLARSQRATRGGIRGATEALVSRPFRRAGGHTSELTNIASPTNSADSGAGESHV